jgi:hypothetical protein
VGVAATRVDVEAVKVVVMVGRIVVVIVHDTATGYCCPFVGSTEIEPALMEVEAVEVAVATREGVAVIALQT